MPRAMPLTTVTPASARLGGKLGGLLQTVACGVARADDANGQPIGCDERAAQEEHTRRVVNLGKQRRIVVARFQQDADVVVTCELDLLVDVDRLSRADNLFG